jgi:Fe-S-cluster containining protein
MNTTAVKCTGACCRNILLNRPRRDLERDVFLDGNRESAKILRFMRLEVVNGIEVHHCLALQETGCWLARHERPEICNVYPTLGPCIHCFARSDAEARGVALMVCP